MQSDATTNSIIDSDIYKCNVCSIISAGGSHTTAISSDGYLFACGANSSGQLGNERVSQTNSSMIKVLDNVISVSAGSSHTAAITSVGYLYTWGNNYCGKLGNGDLIDSYRPVKVMSNVIAVSTGFNHTAAITSDYSLYMWGDNSVGQLGYETNTDHTIPFKMMEDVIAVSAGDQHTAAITKDGSLYTWGDNSFGQLGDGTKTNRTTPVKVMENVVAVSAGGNHTAAITADGNLYTWGRNSAGQLGDGTKTNRTTPVKVMENVVAVSAGGTHTAAISTDGSLYTWGRNSAGQLGNGTNVDSTTAVKVLDNALAVSSGGNHTIAAVLDGSLYSWGYNYYGQIGNGNVENTLIPVKIMERTKLPHNFLRFISNEQEGMYSNISNYYSTTEIRLFRVSALGSAYPSPAGFVVEVGGEQYSSGLTTCTGSDDIKALVPSEYNGDITIFREGYYDYIIPAKMTGQYNTVSMIPESVTSPFVQMLLIDKTQGAYISYCNLLIESEVLYENNLLKENSPKTVRLYPSVQWNGHGEGSVWLEQGDTKIDLLNNTINEFDFSRYAFEANRTVYLCAEAGDGTTIQTATGLKIYKEIDSGIAIDFGDSFAIDVGETDKGDVSILSDSGVKMELDLKSLSDGLVPISVSVKNDGSIEGVIGITLAEGKDTASVFGTIKESLDRLETETTQEQSRRITSLIKEMKANGTPINQASSFGVKGSVQVMGYFTGNFLDGETHLTESKIALIFSGSLSYTYNTVVMGFPAYFKASLSAKIETCFKMKYDEFLQEMVPDGEQGLKATLSLSAEAGPGWEGYLSGGVKGKGSLKLSTQMPIEKDETTFSLQASFSFVGTLYGIDGEWQFYETPEMVFWDGNEPGYWCWKDANDKSLKSAYFKASLTANPMSMDGTGDSIASGVNGYNIPALSILPDGRLIAIWIADVPGRSIIDKGGVYFSIFENNKWSDAKLVSDDGTNDSLPKLFERNGILYAAWQNYSQVFNSDLLPNFDEVREQLTFFSAQFDTESETWGEIKEISENEYLEISDDALPSDYNSEWPTTMSKRQVVDNGEIRAVLYTALDENSIEQVYGVFNDGYNWGETVRLTNEEKGINGFCAVMSTDTIAILYTMGEYDSSTLKMHEAKLCADLSVINVDYIRQTLIPENELTISVMMKNNSPITVNGVSVSIINHEEVVYDEVIAVRFDSGEEDILYVNYLLPNEIDFTSLTVSVLPLFEDDIDKSDNSAVCRLNLKDISVENVSALFIDGTVEALAQVVNRGQVESEEATMVFHKGTVDGVIVGTKAIPSIRPGETYVVVESIDSLQLGDMVYAEILILPDENLICNNTSQAIVIDGTEKTLKLSANASIKEAVALLSVNISNNTPNQLTLYNLILATYDNAGKLLSLETKSEINLDALNSKEFLFEIDVNQNQCTNWKVFLMDNNWIPVCESVSGEICI